MGRKKKIAKNNECATIESKINEIVELGKRKKYLSWDDINEILPMDLTDEEEINELFDELEYYNIDILDEEEDTFFIEKEKKIDTEEARNPLRSYLKEAGTYNLLTHEEEIEIAKGIEEAKKQLSRLSKQLNPSKKQIEKYENQLRKLREKLINSNLRLVINIAKRYSNPKLSILDLIQEGNIGLMRAVEKFKYRTGFKFSTYATWWIRQAITRAIADHSSTIRIPVHMIEKINKVKKIEAKYSQLGEENELSEEEIAKEMNLPVEKIKNIKKSMRPDPVSIDSPVGDEERTTIGDFIEDKFNPNPLSHTRHSLLKEEIEKALSILDEREEIIIRLRFGLDGEGYPRTLEEVGQIFNLTRERIRQIEAKAIQKLKNSYKGKKLQIFNQGIFDLKTFIK
ncbi:MAG: sigma-70 family RNA polymerase sigma factor [Candidatus Omnitrophica bacterium]|nr:sigma-70 family RNA polymerase sigma factor [Candidatus Omnitrophota bacterium]MCM8802190.1 sigma-70 family RNA polymerase sigma factor [Candidatus Omnitrophota bacterium]